MKPEREGGEAAEWPDGRTAGDGDRDLRRRRILEAASRLFRARGLHATGMRDIASALGMATGNLYYYFRNKQDLLAFCQLEALAQLLALTRRVEALDLPPEARLHLLVAGHVRLLNEWIPGSLAHLEVEELDEAARPEIQCRRDRYETSLRRLVEAGRAAGRLRHDVDPKIAVLALLGAANWTVKWYDPDGNESAESIGRRFADLLVRGMLAPGVELESPEPELLTSVLPRREPS